MRLRLLALAVTLLGIAACGKSEEEKAVDRFRALCEGFPAAGTTIRGAEETFSDGTLLVRCGPGVDSGATGEVLLRFQGDSCDHTGTVCDLGWCYFPRDPDICGPNGCWYGCGVRVVPDGADGLPTAQATICGARFFDEQPLPALCISN
jgi:hypothetical protein